MAEGFDVVKKLPAILITGFLGAGKTTFLNELLVYLRMQGKSTALLINEFGRINIDKELIDSNGEMIYEVNQGSIFCVCTRGQFIKALDGIARHTPAFDIAIIESTGLANTGDLGEYLDTPPLSGKIDIKQNFCLIDAANFHKVFETLPAVKTQVQEASVCIVNKTDLASTEYLLELESKLRGLNPDSSIIRTVYGKIDFSETLDLSKTWTTRSGLDTTPPKDIFSVTLEKAGVFDKDMVKHFLKGQAPSLLRAKGFLNTEDGPLFIEWVGDSLFTRSADKEKDKLGRLVLIGYNMDEDRLKNEFSSCLIQPG